MSDDPAAASPRGPLCTPRFRHGVSRRDFLRVCSTLGLGGAASLALGPTACRPLDSLFPEGVICGDPRPEGATLWTRLAPVDPARPESVLWVVAEDAALQRIVRGGLAPAAPGGAHHVKVEVEGLDPDRWYHYGFFSGTGASRVGRLRTAPRPDALPERLRYAFSSCQQRTASYYVAHRAMAREDLDFAMHLGDYIYVSDFGDLTLDDYRRRWAIFRSNPLLQELHAALPLVAMWDDGEFYNGVDRTGDPARLRDARTAWFENMPVARRPDDRVYRRFAWGRLAEVHMIDVRSYRDPEVPPNVLDAAFGLDLQDTRVPGVEAMFAEGRTTLGAEQKAWLLDGMDASPATWQIVGNPYNMNPWRVSDLDTPRARELDPDFLRNAGVYVSNEAWDDYQAERRELLEAFLARDIRNVVFSSGHTHFYLASELQPDFDDESSPSAAVDFVTGSLTADPDPRTIASEEVLRGAEFLFLENNAPYMKHVDLLEQGYTVVEVDPEQIQVDFRGIDTFDPDAEAYTFARFRVRRDSGAIERVPVS